MALAAKQDQVQRVLVTTLVLNMIVAVSKVVIGVVTGALAITADGLHSLVDGSGNVVGLIATHFASQPPDDDHPYGHGRYETLAALVIGALLLFTAWEVGTGAVDRLVSGTPPAITPLAFAIMLVTLVINIFVSRYQVREGNRLESQILLADAANTSADVFVTLSVIVSMVLVVAFGWAWADLVAALAVTVLIGRAALQILRQTGQVLVDKAPYTPEELTRYVLEVPAVERVARVRSRGTTDDAHVDVDVQVAPAMTADQTAAIAGAVRSHLQSEISGISEVEVHFEPDANREVDYTLLARARADALALTTHEVHVTERPDGKVLEMHVEVSSDLTLDAAHEQVSALEDEIRQSAPELAEVITHIEPSPVEQPGNIALDRNQTLESQIRNLLEKNYPDLDWHHLRVYPAQNGYAASMHVKLPSKLTVEAAHQLAESAEAMLRIHIPDLGRVTIHTEPAAESVAHT